MSSELTFQWNRILFRILFRLKCLIPCFSWGIILFWRPRCGACRVLDLRQFSVSIFLKLRPLAIFSCVNQFSRREYIIRFDFLHVLTSLSPITSPPVFRIWLHRKNYHLDGRDKERKTWSKDLGGFQTKSRFSLSFGGWHTRKL